MELENKNNNILDDLDLRNRNWTEIDNTFELKADKTDTYTKTEVDTSLGLKADKQQEAWITPTLLNSWVAIDNNAYPVRYYKDQFGIVRLKGRIQGGTQQLAFTLPTGYRPDSFFLQFTCSVSNDDVGCRVGISSNGYVNIQSNLPLAQGVYLEAITFRAV